MASNGDRKDVNYVSMSAKYDQYILNVVRTIEPSNETWDDATRRTIREARIAVQDELEEYRQAQKEALVGVKGKEDAGTSDKSHGPPCRSPLPSGPTGPTNASQGPQSTEKKPIEIAAQSTKPNPGPNPPPTDDNNDPYPLGPYDGINPEARRALWDIKKTIERIPEAKRQQYLNTDRWVEMLIWDPIPLRAEFYRILNKAVSDNVLPKIDPRQKGSL